MWGGWRGVEGKLGWRSECGEVGRLRDEGGRGVRRVERCRRGVGKK